MELLKLNEEEWNNINSILTSTDKESVNLGFGLLKNVDYNNKDQMNFLENSMDTILDDININNFTKGKIIHTYFTALIKNNTLNK
jgi:hypothetical protein